MVCRDSHLYPLESRVASQLVPLVPNILSVQAEVLPAPRGGQAEAWRAVTALGLVASALQPGPPLPLSRGLSGVLGDGHFRSVKTPADAGPIWVITEAG